MKEIRNKYNGKTIRIQRHIYTITVNNFDVMGGYEPTKIEVILNPRTNGSDASSFERPDNYSYTHGGKVYREACQKAWDIRDEIEASEKTDL